MTTAEIESAANRGNLATADFDPGTTLRNQVIPQFLEDVGPCSWRKGYETITTIAGEQGYNLSRTAVTGAGNWHVLKVHEAFRITGAVPPPPLKYIGEDPALVAMAENDTTQAPPTGYYIELAPGDATTPPSWTRLKLQAPPDAVYSLPVVKLMTVRFLDTITDVDMTPFFPEQFHWALVEGLRAKIFFDRFGQGDSRYDRAQAEYLGWVERVKIQRELGRRNLFVSVR